MLKETLQQIEGTLTRGSPPDDPQRWLDIVTQFGRRFVPIVDNLLAAIKPIVPARVWLESHQEFLSTREPTVSLIEFRMRPPDSYYTSQGRRLPQPADPQGVHATGLEVSLALYRGHETQAGATAPVMALEFEVWGAHERRCFARLLRDHRYMVEQLVARSGATLFTSCVFDNLEQAPRASTAEQLALYFDNEVDDEDQFTLQCKFGVEATQADIVRALLPAIALYDAALGYCQLQPQRGRPLQYAAIGGAWK